MCQFARAPLSLWLCHPFILFCQTYLQSSPVTRSLKRVAALHFHSVCHPRATVLPSAKLWTSFLPMPSQIENSGKEKVIHTEYVTFIKMDRLEEDLLFKTDTIRVALPLQAQVNVTLPEELENGCRDSESGHGRTHLFSQFHKGLHHWFAVHSMCCSSDTWKAHCGFR